jgi:hypothetical protein
MTAKHISVRCHPEVGEKLAAIMAHWYCNQAAAITRLICQEHARMQADSSQSGRSGVDANLAASQIQTQSNGSVVQIAAETQPDSEAQRMARENAESITRLRARGQGDFADALEDFTASFDR